MTWSGQQDSALKAVAAWAKDARGAQVFRLFGYAGTGKTTLAKEIAGQVKGKVLFAAYTGKAALVLQSKGCTDASTIHSLIYKIEDNNGGIPTFTLDPLSKVADAALVIIDECSMVDEDIGNDLLSFGTKVLVLGDPAQLPPVRGAGFFTSAAPDVMLTEVHRQARDNPIIHLSMLVREQQLLKPGNFGGSTVCSRRSITTESVRDADQVLVGTNMTRRRYNSRLRDIRGFAGNTPLVGERLVCLRNKREKGLLNGGIWLVDRLLETNELRVHMHVSPLDAGANKQKADVIVHPFFFLGRERELEWDELRGLDQFDFGYALTVHKSQGSQWDDVVLFDESAAFREASHRSKWLYTGITRAAERITVVM